MVTEKDYTNTKEEDFSENTSDYANTKNTTENGENTSLKDGENGEEN
jgi:hypothetical protein